MVVLAGVLLGSALGGMARFWLTGMVNRRLGQHFPWGTLVVNVSGAFVIGLAAALFPGDNLGQIAGLAWHAAVLGFLGSYTTVSSFSLETLALARAGSWPRVAGNIGLSFGVCLVAAGIGLATGATLAGGLA